MIFSMIMLSTGIYLRAQFSCSTTDYCNLDLRSEIFTDAKIDSIKNISYAKSPQNSNFRDWVLKGDNDCEETAADECQNSSEALFFNIYFPKNTFYEYYNTCPLPVIFMFHPGGFSDCSSIDNTVGIRYMCREFAKRGFVVFNVEYRRGTLLYPGPDEFVNLRTKTIYQQVAVYRAVQDVRGAIRSALKMKADGIFASSFAFSENKVFGAGASAGSGAVLTTAFLQTQAMVDAVSPGFKDRLGNINADYYYAPPSYSLPEFKGILNMWGNFPMQGSISTEAQAASFFNQNAYIAPVISFQGKEDKVVDFNYRYEQFPPTVPILGDPRGNYDTTSFCLENSGTISVTPGELGKDLLMIGALTIRDLVKNKGKQTETYLDCDMVHGLDKDPTNCCTSDNKKLPACSQTCYKTAFGTNNITSDGVQLYMVQRAAIFFQSILTNTNIPGPDLFVDCENKRFKCAQTANNNGCSNNDECQ